MTTMYQAFDGNLFCSKNNCRNYELDTFYGHITFWDHNDEERDWESLYEMMEMEDSDLPIDRFFVDTPELAKAFNQLLESFGYKGIEGELKAGYYRWDDDEGWRSYNEEK